MANIALITTNTTHVATTENKNAIQAQGHIVDVYLDTDVTQATLESYDLVVGAYMGYSAAADTAAKLTAVNATTPLLIGTLDGGMGANADQTESVAAKMGLIQSTYYSGSNLQNYLVINSLTHPILANAFTTTGTKNLSTTGGYNSTTRQAHIGQNLGYNSSLSNNVNHAALIAIPSNTARLGGGTTGRRIVVMSGLYGGAPYSADGRALIRESINWALISDNIDINTTTTPATASTEMVDPNVFIGIDTTYSAGVATALAESVDPVITTTSNVTIPAGVVEASASMPEHTGKGNTYRLDPIADGELSADGTWRPFEVTPETSYNGPTLFIKFAQIPEAEAVMSAKLYLPVRERPTYSNSINMQISRVTQDWSDTVAPRIDAYTTTNQLSVYTAGGNIPDVLEYDITNLYKDISAAADYGIRLKNTYTGGTYTSYLGIYSLESAAGSPLPYIEVATTPAQGINVTADPGIADATMVGSTVLTGTSVSFSATPGTVSGVMLDGIVTTEIIPDYTFAAEAFTGTAEITEATASFPAEFAAGAAEASAFINDVTVETENSPIYKADPMTATSRIIDPLESAVTVEDDPLYQYLVNYTWGGTTWGSGGINQSGSYRDWFLYPFQERRDTDPIGGRIQPNTTEVGNVILGDSGLEGRWSARFDGTSYIKSDNYVEDDEQYFTRTGNDEVYTFMIKTTKKDQYIVGDDTEGIMLKDGRLCANGAISFTDIADNKWHWVVVKAARRSGSTSEIMEFWVDGWLDRRMAPNYSAAFLETLPAPARRLPAGIGGIGGTQFVSSSLRFEGNLAYVGYFQDWNTTDYDQKEMYYRAFGIVPVRAGTMEGSAEIQNARGKGNRLRALVVTFGGYSADTVTWNLRERVPRRFEPVLNLQKDRGTDAKPYYYGEYLVEFQNAYSKDVFGHGGDYWRDERTYERRMINVMEDVDIQQYDLLIIEGYPDAGDEWGQIVGHDEAPWDEWTRQEGIDAKLTMLKHIREAQDTYGISFLITNPVLAMDYGIISKYEEHTQAFMVGEAKYEGAGMFDNGYPHADWRAAQIDPARIINTIPGRDTRTEQTREMQAGGENGERYYDTHRINKHRVVATIPDLTDIPSWIWVDYVQSYMPDGMDGEGFHTKLVDRTDGMVIGDEFFINGVNNGATDRRVVRPGERGTGLIPAIPPTAVMAGTVVTRENATHWTGTQEVPNPYKDYATSIVVFPGDRVAGEPIGGKVFVDITDAPHINNIEVGAGISDASAYIQEVPEDDSFEPAWSPTREWTYSSMRMTTSTTSAKAAEGFTINPETGRLELWVEDDPIVMFRYRQIYELRGVPVWNLLRRGLHWLGIRDTVGLGGVRVRTQALESTSVMNDPTIYSEKGVVVNAQSAIGVSRIVPPAEADTPNADVYALPMYGSAEITGMSVTFATGPMTATGEMLYDLEAMFRLGEEIMLYVTETNEITLFVLEDA